MPIKGEQQRVSEIKTMFLLQRLVLLWRAQYDGLVEAQSTEDQA